MSFLAHVNWGKALAVAVIVLSLGACASYVAVRDYRRALYWLFTAAIVATVTL